jgi:hypothetical protein
MDLVAAHLVDDRVAEAAGQGDVIEQDVGRAPLPDADGGDVELDQSIVHHNIIVAREIAPGLVGKVDPARAGGYPVVVQHVVSDHRVLHRDEAEPLPSVVMHDIVLDDGAGDDAVAAGITVTV